VRQNYVLMPEAWIFRDLFDGGTNNRLNDRHRDNDFDTKSRHMACRLFNVMQICRLLALVEVFSGFPAWSQLWLKIVSYGYD
jgi:hypothetical protein